MAQYAVALILIVVAVAVVVQIAVRAKKTGQQEEARRKAVERESRLLERRKKPRD